MFVGLEPPGIISTDVLSVPVGYVLELRVVVGIPTLACLSGVALRDGLSSFSPPEPPPITSASMLALALTFGGTYWDRGRTSKQQIRSSPP